MHTRSGLDGVGIVVVGYGRTELAQHVAELLAAADDALVVVNPRGREAVVVPETVVTVAMPSNVGYAAAVNRGEAELDGSCDVIVVLTHDADLTTTGVEALVATLRSDDRYAVVGPALLVGDQLRVGGDYVGPGRARHRLDERHTHRDTHRLTGPHAVDWVDGSIMVIRRDVFRAVGGFDASTFMYVDELAFCLDVADAGHSVIVDPRVVASQDAGAPNRPRAHAFLIVRNHIRLAHRRGGASAAVRAGWAGAAFAGRSMVRSVLGAAPGRRFHLQSTAGALDGGVAGLVGRDGPPPPRVTRHTDVVLDGPAAARSSNEPPLPLMLMYWGRRGAGSRLMYDLADAMTRRDDVVAHVSISRQGEMRDEIVGLGVDAHEVRTPRSARGALLGAPALVWGWIGLVRTIRRVSPAAVVVVMGSPWSDVVARPLGWLIRRGGARFVRFVHDAVPHPGDQNRSPVAIERAAMRGADTYVVLSEHVEQQLIETGVPAQKIWRSALGPFSLGRPRDRVGEPHEPFRVLFFGRLESYKGIHLLTESAGLLDDGSVEIRIVGDGELVIDDSHSSVTVERRWVAEDELRDTLVWADAVVLPYVEASQSGVGPMAQALGIPSIVTPVGGLIEQLDPGVTGVVADELTASALAAAISELAGDRPRYAAMALNCVESASVSSTWDEIAAGLIEKIRANSHDRG